MSLQESLLMSIFVMLLSSSVASSYTPSSVSVWTTVPLDPAQHLSSQTPLAFSPSSCSAPSFSSLPTVSIAPNRLQPLVGFGASLTETTAYNFLMLKQRNATAYSALMTSLFAPAPAGIGINFMRVPVTSCDLIEPAGAVPWWTFDDTPGDVQLTHFNSSQALEYQIPVLQDVMAIVRATGGQMRLVGTPWTAPTWIKDSNSWYGGSIIDSYYPFYAQYLTNVALTFQALGIPLYALSLQNEPTYSWSNYPATLLSPQNETVLANLLQPALRAAGLDTLVMAWDSDPNVPFAWQVMDGVGGSGKSVDAIGWHCYSGDVYNQTLFHNAYPDTLLLFTECSSFNQEYTTADFLNNFMFEMNSVYFGNLNNWGSSGQHWSLAVDLNSGPHQGGCTDCAGTVTVDAANLTRPYVVLYNAQYYSIAHFSTLIPPMSYRLDSTVLAVNGLQSFTAVTPDGSVVVQLLNQNSATQTVLVQDQAAGSCVAVTLQPMSLTSLKYATGSSGGGGGLSGGAVAGVVIAVLIGLAVVVGVGWMVWSRRSSSAGGGGSGGGGGEGRWQQYRDGSRGGMELSLH